MDSREDGDPSPEPARDDSGEGEGGDATERRMGEQPLTPEEQARFRTTADEAGRLLCSGMFDEAVVEAFWQLEALADFRHPMACATIAASEPALRGLLTAAREPGLLLGTTYDGAAVYLDQCAMSVLANVTFNEPDAIMDAHLPAICALYTHGRTSASFERTFLLTLINMACWGKNAPEKLRAAGVVDLIRACFEAGDSPYVFMSALLMAILTGHGEDNPFLLPAHVATFGHLTSVLINALDDDTNSHYENIKWSAVSPTLALEILSIADSNKPLILKAGVVPHLLALLSRSTPTALDIPRDFNRARRYAVNALYNMAFAPELAPHVPEIRAVLRRMTTNPATVEGLRGLAARTLFQLALKDSATQQNPQPQPQPQEGGEVAICFASAQREAAEAVARQLASAGHAVRTSPDNGQVGVLEGAKAVVLLVDRAFKESPAARTQVDVARILGKPVFPVLAEPGYRPDGWLRGVTDGVDVLSLEQDEDASQLAQLLSDTLQLGPRSPP